MNLWGMIWLGIATVIFLLAATVAKHWAVAPHVGKVVLALALYSAGNLIMLRLVRDFGMDAPAPSPISTSTVSPCSS